MDVKLGKAGTKKETKEKGHWKMPVILAAKVAKDLLELRKQIGRVERKATHEEYANGREGEIRKKKKKKRG